MWRQPPRRADVDVLGPLDAAFLEAEDADPHTSMAIASVALFDGEPPDDEQLHGAFASKLSLLPRYHQLVRRMPFDLAAPVWVEDARFDLRYHLRRTALPAPGGDAELHRLIARVMSQRLDRERPLWEVWVVERLATGQWALISKVHHCMVDGVAGTELYHLLLSATPDVDDVAGIRFEPLPAPPAVSVAIDVARRAAAAPVREVTGVLRSLSRPRFLIGRAVTTARGVRALLPAGLPADRTSLLGAIHRDRRYGAATVSLSEVKAIRKRFDVTVNDVALAALTAGFRELLQARGETCTASAVRSLIPVNVRVRGTEGELANRVSCLIVDLPVLVADPVERLEAVHRMVCAARNAHEAVAGQALVELSGWAPFGPLAAGLRAAFRWPQRSIVTVTTNVPGPSQPLYLLGRRMTRLLPYVPIADQLRIGVAILSYCDELTFGVTGDYAGAPDLEILLDAAVREVDVLSGRSPRIRRSVTKASG